MECITDAEIDLEHIRNAALDRGMPHDADVASWIRQTVSAVPLQAELGYCRVSADQVNVGLCTRGEWVTCLSLMRQGEKVMIYECGARHPAIKILELTLTKERFCGVSIDGIVEYLAGEGWKEIKDGDV